MISHTEKEIIQELKHLLGEDRVCFDEPMSRHTTFQTGGPADIFIEPSEEEIVPILSVCGDGGIPVTVIGNGSNLLVSDRGIRGVVLCVGKGMKGMRTDGEHLIVRAGELLSRAASHAADEGLGGMEFAAGIPGSVGGAVVMNAGAYGGEMKQILSSVSVIYSNGDKRVYSVDELDLSYRHSRFEKEDAIVTEAVFSLKRMEREGIRRRMQELSDRRREKQPLEYPSAGSTFKRPEGYFAGKLIMDAGLAGFRIGGAKVSEKHCGFVINDDHATADDIRRLIDEVTVRVQKVSGVTLEPEVRFIGEFS